MKISKGGTLAIAAIALTGIIIGADVIHVLNSGIGAHGTIEADKAVADVGEEILFSIVDNGVGSSMTTRFIINFHDGTPPAEMNNRFSITHSFPFEGLYSITMIAISTSGLTSTSFTQVEIINQRPAVDIIKPGFAYEDQNVTFSVDNRTTGTYPDTDHDQDGLKYQWRFGDGTTGAGNNVSKVFAQSGEYPVDVYVSDDQGAVGYSTTTFTVVNVIPSPDFTWYPVSGKEDARILFDASNTHDTPSDINDTQYFWNFGDGQVARYKYLYHTFISSGAFPVTLTVIDNDGARNQTTKMVTINNDNPTSTTHAKNNTLREGETGIFGVNVDDTPTDEDLMEYAWSTGGNGSITTNRFIDDWNGNVYASSTDPDNAQATSSTRVSVVNTKPYVMIDSISMVGNVTLSMAGFPRNTLFMRVIRNGVEQAATSLTRHDSCPRPNNVTTTLDMNFNLADDWAIEVFYGHLNETLFPNGTSGIPDINDLLVNDSMQYLIYGPTNESRGANPAWLQFNFHDGYSFKLFRVFWVWNNNSWVWRINPKDYLTTSTLTLKGHAIDRGADNLGVEITYGNKTSQLVSNTPGYIEFQYDIHGWDNWDSYWSDRYAAWWGRYDEFFAGWDNDFEAWFDAWWLENQGIDPLEWWHSFLVRWEHNPNFIDQIFNKKWSKFHEMWNNDWMDWWSAEWQSNAWFSWNPVTILAFDDDLATSILTVRMHSDQGIPTIYNLSPQVSIQSPGTTIVEDALAVFEAPTIDYYNTSIVTNPELLHFTWDFGDGTITSASSTMNHTWSTAGEYLVQVLVSDGEYTGTALLLVNVVNTLPQVITVSGPQNMTEDYIARFSVENNTIDSASDMGSLRFIWDFADGTFATGKTVEHAWAIDGFYNITVYAIDNNGAVTSKIHPIVVCEVNPCIKGPYNIQVFEGNFISYNMSFEDTILDQQALAFTWNIDGVNYSSPRLQTLLGVGYHSGTLTLTDADGNTDVDDILIYVDNVIPSVSIQNRVLYGPSMPVILTAYAMDDIRGMGDLVFNWTLNGTYTPIDTTMVDDGCVSVVTWEPGHSGNYEARVSVTDATGATVESQFIIYVTLDTDLDGVPDELEASFGLGSSGPDSDGDMLCDAYEINYTRTDPADFDTDDDLLWDGINPAVGTGEAYLGTDPRKNDTDGDGLLDGIEVFGWNISVQFLNGTIDNRTVTSDPLVIDTDKDRLTDYQEFLNHTDPRSADTDKDGKSDFLESEYANLVDTDNDGVSDIKETETGLIVRFSNGTSIRVFSNATNNDTDGDGLKDYEEWYPAGDGFITNPANNDTDGDGILDLAEGFTKVQEYGIRKKIVAGTTGYFYFYANFGSNLKNITVTFGATTAADKSADFHAIVKFQNQLVIDNSSAGSTYYFNASDVTKKTGFRANGLWELWIMPTGQDAMLELFKVEAAVQLNPVNPDTDGDQLNDGIETTGKTYGWITDPTMADSDNDMWSDYAEVVTKHTNPLERDTDGDGVVDPSDADPIRNVILGVTVKSATWADAFWRDIDNSNPELSVVTTIDGRAVASPKQTTSGPEAPRSIVTYIWGVTDTHGSIWPWDWSYGWIPITLASWTIATTATFNKVYYFDIPDDRRTVSIQTQLWHIWQYCDDVGDKVGESARTYTVGTSGNRDSNFPIYSGSNVVTYDIKTIGLEKVNTVAIYENESTFIGHHYQTITQQNIIMLQITDSVPTDHPYFRSGLNVIIIPTEIFTDTKLHKVIELAVDGIMIDTSLLPACLKDADFSGIDRTAGSIARHVESIINHTVDLNTAMTILNTFVLILASNESITGYKAMRVGATTLGIASDVLSLIPWDGAIFTTQSSAGPMPRTLLSAIGSFFVSLAQMLWGGIVAIFNFFVYLVTLVVQWGMKAVGEAIQTAIAAVELLVKAIILAFAYLTFLITLVMFAGVFLALIPVFLLFQLIIECDLEISINTISIIKNDITATFQYSITLFYVKFLDISVPNLRISIDTETISHNLDVNLFSTFEGNISEIFTNFIPTDIDRAENSNSMVINTQETNIEQSNNSEFYLAGIFFVYMLLGAAMALGAGLANILSGPLEKWAFFITIIGVFISCWAVYNSFRISDQSENKRNSKDFLKGMLMGFLGALLLNLLNAVIINIIPVFADKVTKVITYILLFITLFSITMNALLINSNLPDEVRMVISNISGFVDCFGIVIGGTAIATIDDSTKRSNWMIGFLVLTMFSLVIYGFLWATNPI